MDTSTDEAISWEWETGSKGGVFQKYNAEITNAAEAAYQAYQSRDGDGRALVQIRDVSYIIDTVQLKQLKEHDQTKTRAIRRVDPSGQILCAMPRPVRTAPPNGAGVPSYMSTFVHTSPHPQRTFLLAPIPPYPCCFPQKRILTGLIYRFTALTMPKLYCFTKVESSLVYALVRKEWHLISRQEDGTLIVKLRDGTMCEVEQINHFGFCPQEAKGPTSTNSPSH